MAYVSSFVFCDQIRIENINNESIRNIVTPLSELRLINIPGNFTFSIAMTVSDINLLDKNHIKIELVDPKEKVINIIADSDIPPLPPEYKDKAGSKSLNLNLEIRNNVFHEAGMHTVTVQLNDGDVDKHEIMVRKAE